MDISETIIGLEPLNIDEVKNYLKINFDEDDLLLSDMIIAAREQAEKFTGLSLIEKEITLFASDYDNEIELPYPAHGEVVEVEINGQDVLANCTILGNKNKSVIVPVVYESISSGDGVEIIYTTTGDCPAAIKVALLKNIAEWYENRGNSSDNSINQLSENTISILTRFMKL